MRAAALWLLLAFGTQWADKFINSARYLSINRL